MMALDELFSNNYKSKMIFSIIWIFTQVSFDATASY